MKVGNLTNLIVDTQDIIGFFSDHEANTPEKMKEALEKIAAEECESFFVTVQELAESLRKVVDDEIEVPDQAITGNDLLADSEIQDELAAARGEKTEIE